jgi:hypothetical protein
MGNLHSLSSIHKHVLWLGVLWLGLSYTKAQTTPTNINERADEVLRAATHYLADSPHFTALAEVWRERVAESGEKLQFTRVVELAVRRPDRLHVEIRSGFTDRGFWYDGKKLSVMDRKANVFSSTPMPPTIDAALDNARDEFGIDLPLIDLAVSDPYKNATARVERGRYFGVSPVLGVDCHHLAFTQDNIDWQLWVETGPHPLIRKLVINHKNEEGSPEFLALITKWDLVDRISDSDFAFVAPAGATKIEMKRPTAADSESTTSKPQASAQ